MAEVGGHLCRSAGPTPNAQAGSTKQEAQGPIQTVSECLKGWRPHHLSVQLVQWSITHSKKSVYWCSGKTLCFSLYPLLLVPSLCTTEKPYFCLLCTLLLLFPHMDDVLSKPSLFWAGQSHLSQTFSTGEILQSLHHFSGTLLVSVQQPHISLALGSPKLSTAPLVHLSRGGAAAPSACSSQVTLGGLCCKGMFLAHTQFAVPLAPRAFPEESRQPKQDTQATLN